MPARLLKLHVHNLTLPPPPLLLTLGCCPLCAGVHPVWRAAALWRVPAVRRLVSGAAGGMAWATAIDSSRCWQRSGSGGMGVIPCGVADTACQPEGQPFTALLPLGVSPPVVAHTRPHMSSLFLLISHPMHLRSPLLPLVHPAYPPGTSTTASSCTRATPAATTAAGRRWPLAAATRRRRTCSRRTTRTTSPWSRRCHWSSR